MPVSLVTGGAGFIGSHVADSLLERGHQVVILDDLSGGFAENVPSGATLVQGSILDCNLIDQLFLKHSFTYLYHLAAYAAEGLSQFIKRFNYQNNLIGSVNLLNACVKHNVKCFVFTSSIAVYGEGKTPMSEDMTPVPGDSYGIAKLAVEQELRISHDMFGLDYIIFRPHNVYGERQNIGDRYRNVVGIFMNQLLRGEPLTIFGDGMQLRAFTHIGDVARLITRSVEIPSARNQALNIGTDEVHSINDLAAIVSGVMGINAQMIHLEPRKEAKRVYADHSKARRIFGGTPQTSLTEGIRAMANWVKAHGARESSVIEEIELTKNLPEFWASVGRKTVPVL